MVPFFRATVIMFFLASSTPLRIASGTSAALPRPAPILPLPSPTTTTAAKEKRRPPFTTLATRLMKTTFSCKSDSCFQILACAFSFTLKFQAGFAGTFSQSLYSAVIDIAAAIEYYGFNALSRALLATRAPTALAASALPP